MSAFPSVGIIPGYLRVTAVPLLRGRQYSAGELYSLSRLPTDAIGVAALTLTNLVIGSAVQVEVASTGAVISYTVVASTTLVLTVPVYQSGTAGNFLRIKVRKGNASPYYQPFETLETVFVGSDSIYISQMKDE